MDRQLYFNKCLFKLNFRCLFMAYVDYYYYYLLLS